MSIGACFYSIDATVIATLLDNPDLIGEHLDLDPSAGGPKAELTVEQAWDVVRALLPESIGDDFLEAPDAGEMGVFHMSAADVATAAQRLDAKNLPELIREFSALSGEHAELYWAEYWAENSEDLKEVLNDVVHFFISSAARGDAVLFCIG